MDDEAKFVRELMQPLLSVLTAEQQKTAQQIIGVEAPGVFAWAVKSGYLLWTRTHPGEKPARAMVFSWMIQGEGKASNG